VAVTGVTRKMHALELCAVYNSSIIIQMIKSRWVRGVCERRKGMQNFAGEKCRKGIGIRNRRESAIKMNLRKK
jgi:hypothetical protein